MRNLNSYLLFVICLSLSQALTAQTVPQGMRYQAVAHDMKGAPMSNKAISLQIDILAGGPEGKSVYRESHRVTTDEGGLFAITVGDGTVEAGQFSKIPWSTEEMWLQMAIDEKGENDFKLLTASRLLTVPYAFHAGSAEMILISGEESKGCSTGGIPFWSNLGNAYVNDTCHFIGTTIAADLVFKTNGMERMRITKEGALRVLGDATVVNNLVVTEDTALVAHQFVVGEDAFIAGNLRVKGSIDLSNSMLTAKCLTLLGGCDWYELSQATDDIQAGEVAIIDPTGPVNSVRRSTCAYDPLVTGVVSGAGGINPGIGLTQAGVLDGDTKIAMGGKVKVRVTGKVKRGDLLTSSNQPGCAMAVKNRKKALGAVLGKALSTPDAEGLVLMQVMMR